MTTAHAALNGAPPRNAIAATWLCDRESVRKRRARTPSLAPLSRVLTSLDLKRGRTSSVRSGLTGSAPAINDPAHFIYFSQTGHNLGNGFLTYWQQNGGLARFGLPLSEEHLELNAATGQQYTVQWFERARFEWHPENAGTPYMILLGLLGKEYSGITF